MLDKGPINRIIYTQHDSIYIQLKHKGKLTDCVRTRDSGTTGAFCLGPGAGTSVVLAMLCF